MLGHAEQFFRHCEFGGEKQGLNPMVARRRKQQKLAVQRFGGEKSQQLVGVGRAEPVLLQARRCSSMPYSFRRVGGSSANRSFYGFLTLRSQTAPRRRPLPCRAKERAFNKTVSSRIHKEGNGRHRHPFTRDVAGGTSMKPITPVMLLVAIAVGGAAAFLTVVMGTTTNKTFSNVASAIQSTGGAAFALDEARALRQPAAREEVVAMADKPAVPLAGGDGPPPPAATPVKRQIVYNAAVSLAVADFDARQRELTGLVKLHNAFVAKSDMSGNSVAQRSGQWKIRVPVEQFDHFLAAVVGLGIPEKNTVDSQDVTEEFYDLKARIDNKKTLEQRFIVLIQQANGRFEEVIRLENELARVRGEIERMEGGLRRLADLSALSTVAVTLREEQNYVPPQAPTFGGQISATFGQSIHLLTTIGGGATLTLVALVPWTPFALAGVAAYLYLRKRWNRTQPIVEPR